MAATPSLPHLVDARDLPHQACSAHRLAPRHARTGLGIGRIYSRLFDPTGAFFANHAREQGVPPGETNGRATPLIAKRSDFSMKIFVSAIVMMVGWLSEMAAAETGNAPFCLQTAAGAKCVYSTMGECERARGNSSTAQCITQADAKGATGLGEPPGAPPGLPAGQ
jgi:hypothetical protein